MGPRHQVGHNVEAAWHVDDLVHEFSHVGELSLLPSCPGVRQSGQGECEWLVICPNGEEAAFQVMAEVSDSRVDAEKLPVEGTVGQLSFLQFC